ncbi:MAG: rhomboid family intramembrane serine protease [Thermodesulfobacteriota bacterium]
MFPIKDNIPAHRFPVVNLWLIVINGICFVYEFSLRGELHNFIQAHGFVPARFMAAQLENFFDLSRFLPVFSSMFLHGGFLHLFFNMWMLWIFGDNVEDSMGPRRYLIFYLLCGSVSVFAQGVADPMSTVPMVGASGAISGVLGAYFVLYPGAKILTLIPIFIIFYTIEIPAFVFLGFWLVIQFLQGYASQLTTDGQAVGGVAWWAHIGGFLAGVLLVNVFRQRSKKYGRGKWRK